MIYLSLVGEQPMPILLPLWQDSGYSALQLIATPITLAVAKAIGTFINKDSALRSLKVLPVVTVDAYDLNKSTDMIRQILLKFGDNRVILNLTGGTKIMSIAAMQAARGKSIVLLYVSMEERNLIYFSTETAKTKSVPINVKISVDQYLNAHGLETSDSQNFGYRYSDIAPAKEGDELEEKVFTLARDSGVFDDVRRNLHIRKATGDHFVTNELDVVATHNGSLVVCSCKSGKIGNQALYELTSLSRREVAGIYCGKALASSKKTLPPGVVNRAREDHIRLICADELENAAQILFQTIR